MSSHDPWLNPRLRFWLTACTGLRALPHFGYLLRVPFQQPIAFLDERTPPQTGFLIIGEVVDLRGLEVVAWK